jgi:hypothetical protein
MFASNQHTWADGSSFTSELHLPVSFAVHTPPPILCGCTLCNTHMHSSHLQGVCKKMCELPIPPVSPSPGVSPGVSPSPDPIPPPIYVNGPVLDPACVAKYQSTLLLPPIMPRLTGVSRYLHCTVIMLLVVKPLLHHSSSLPRAAHVMKHCVCSDTSASKPCCCCCCTLVTSISY